jgi:hypothetical protein
MGKKIELVDPSLPSRKREGRFSIFLPRLRGRVGWGIAEFLPPPEPAPAPQ